MLRQPGSGFFGRPSGMSGCFLYVRLTMRKRNRCFSANPPDETAVRRSRLP